MLGAGIPAFSYEGVGAQPGPMAAQPGPVAAAMADFDDEVGAQDEANDDVVSMSPLALQIWLV